MRSIIDEIAEALPDWMKDSSKITIVPEVGSGPPMGNEKLARIAGSGRGATQATVRVDFANVPRDVRIAPQGNTGVDLDLSLGYSMLT